MAPLDPLLGIHAAVNRTTADGRYPAGWQPAQKLSVQQAVAAFTTGAAFAEFAEAEKGTLTPGKFADLVVLSADPFAVEACQLQEIEVLRTFAGGSPVYERA